MPRTTLTLDSDVYTALERRRRSRGTTFKQEVNELLRAGMLREEEPPERSERFQTEALALGRPLIESFDDIASVLELAEGDEHR